MHHFIRFLSCYLRDLAMDLCRDQCVHFSGWLGWVDTEGLRGEGGVD
jgi:hypothetical protein